ncbi:MAG: Rad52/22 double-strand break repair protein [Gemmatimonadales bacterium]|nr:Rad52/22 double-strand break repair protein [Gemmatimonadales bacterium]
MDESMIARQDAYIEKTDVWAKLSAPVPSDVISWRQDGKVTARDGKYFARFVAYVEANTVRERLDAVVPGEWDLTLDLMPAVSAEDGDGAQCSFKARLQILGVIREDIGTGRDYKSASTDAFKRAAVRFGIAHELYAYEQNWVEMDGDGKYPKPLEDPQVAYARRYGKSGAGSVAATGTTPPAAPSSSLTDMDVVSCPKCGGRMWDNRLTKRNPRAPDYKCQSRSCDGVVWPAKTAATLPAEGEEGQGGGKSSALVGAEEEELPF